MGDCKGEGLGDCKGEGLDPLSCTPVPHALPFVLLLLILRLYSLLRSSPLLPFGLHWVGLHSYLWKRTVLEVQTDVVLFISLSLYNVQVLILFFVRSSTVYILVRTRSQ